MSLFDKQVVFAKSFALLIIKAFDMGYQVTINQVLRTPQEAAANAVSGAGISNSLHLLKLAGDLNLFKDGTFLTTTEDYTALGEYWESLSTQDYTMCWGGRFLKTDADHFSVAANGYK